jgi:HAD superfamily hydrolase (TIGR01549 family)
MHFKCLLLDLDDTLYNYEHCHKLALDGVINKFDKSFNSRDVYGQVNKKLKYELYGTASSHNVCIYIKHMIEYLGLDLSLTTELYNVYWDIFYANMTCHDNVMHFIEWIKQQNIKIVIITDYACENQLQKLKTLQILQYIDHIITSEEIGIEKPSKQIFLSALNLADVNHTEVIMIGDNYLKDICGAQNLGILCYWFNKNNKEPVISNNEFNNFGQIHTHFKEIQNELFKLEYMSRYCGERFDLTQAGGGNISVKHENLMYIKASGYQLSQVSTTSGYVVINNSILKKDILSDNVKSVTYYNHIGKERGSIETYMHSILKKYTIHLHPIQSNKILMGTKYKEDIQKICMDDYMIIDYDTPGINVCNKIRKSYNNESIIFMVNHGIIITTDVYEDILPMLESVLNKFDCGYEKYKYVNTLSKLSNTTDRYENVCYLCEDLVINNYLINKKELFTCGIIMPDVLIYCGIKILFMNTDKCIHDYVSKYNESPKVVVVNNLIYIINVSLCKCRDTESVLKSNLMILDTVKEASYLSDDEICYLNNWDAEKYRKTL